MSEIVEEDDQHSSAISVSAWDRKKQRSFIICGQAKRAEEMEVGIREESEIIEEEISEEEISENDISDKEESAQISPAAMLAHHMPSRNRGGRGRGGRHVLRERENIKPAGRGRGARRGGFGKIKKSSQESMTKPSHGSSSTASEIAEDFSSLAVSQPKTASNTSALTTSRELGNTQSGKRSPKKYEYTHDNMRDTSINDAQSLDNCSNIGQFDTAESEPESSVSILESNHGTLQQSYTTTTFARSESAMSQRDNFLYEESIDGHLSESQTAKYSDLMPSRKKAREKKIALYKEAARIAKLQDEYEQETARQSNRDFEQPIVKNKRERKREKTKTKKVLTVEENLHETDEEEIEIVEPIMSTYRSGENAFANNYQTMKREPRLLPAYQYLLNEYSTAVSTLSYVERRREERSHLNKSSHIEKIQKSIDGFKWRLYEEQQTFYEAPKLNYGKAIRIENYNTQQSSEKRKKSYKTQKQFKVNVRTVFESSQQPFRINLKDVGEFDIVFFRKNINDEEFITFSVDPFHNFTGKTQIGMEIIPSEKFRSKKKTARQFVFGNEKTDPWPMNRIYIDESFRKCYLEDDKYFTANIYIISCEVYLSPCIRIVRLLQESRANLRESMKSYMAFVKKPEDCEHRGVSDRESEDDSPF